MIGNMLRIAVYLAPAVLVFACMQSYNGPQWISDAVAGIVISILLYIPDH